MKLRQRHLLGLCILDITALQEWVDCYLKGLIQHLSDKSLKKWAGWSVQARIGVDFDQIHIQIIIYHKIVSKKLKLIIYFLFLNLIDRLDILKACPKSFKRILDCLAHLWINYFEKVDFFEVLQVLSEIFERYFVSLLVFAVFTAILLDGIICEMDVSVTEVFDIVFETGCSDVSFFIEVTTIVNAIDDLG